MGDRLTVAVDALAVTPGGGLSYLQRQLPALQANGIDLVLFVDSNVVEELREPLPVATVVERSGQEARLLRLG